jgi:hypothetical protein
MVIFDKFVSSKNKISAYRNSSSAWHFFYCANYSQPVRLSYQPPASSTFLSEQISHQQLASSTFFSEQTSTIHQPPVKRTGYQLLNHGHRVENEKDGGVFKIVKGS